MIRRYISSQRLFKQCNYMITSKSKIKDCLLQFFQVPTSVKQLSKKTRILPIFFSSNYVKQFCQSQFFQQYQQYLQKKFQHFHQQKKTILYSDKYNQYTPIIGCYIDWLLKHSKIQKLQLNDQIMEIMNLSNPQFWFDPYHLKLKRQFIYHHGPTNSGKTYNAIKQLKQLQPSKIGIYLAPLRLLAWETAQKLGHCNLVTGQDKQYVNSHLTSCTIETLSIFQEYDVAVIDEIQMIGDLQRGWSWTKAVIGLKAKKIHLCGNQRALHLISRLVEKTGDTLTEKRYSRLSKLILIQQPFDIQKIKPGDCLVKFQSQQLVNLRQKINMFSHIAEAKAKGVEGDVYRKQSIKNKTAIIYGKLPPQCRKNQAKQFNNTNFPYLVASDAIGMGLNLKIRKIIFLSITKSKSVGLPRKLAQHQIQQIAGRAGRGNVEGYVQCINSKILNTVKKALEHVNKTYGLNLESRGQQLPENTTQQTQKQSSNTIQGQPKYNVANTTIHAELLSSNKLQLHKLNKQSTAALQNSIQADQDQQDHLSDNYSKNLGRYLTKNECKIQKAQLFFPSSYIIRMKLELEKLDSSIVNLSQVVKILITYSKIQESLFEISKKRKLLYWFQILQKHCLNQNQQYNLGSIYQMKNDYDVCEKVYNNFTLKFAQNQKVPFPDFIKEKCESQKIDKITNIIILQQYYLISQAYVLLWNQFQSTFPEINQAKEAKLKLASKISNTLKNQSQFAAKIEDHLYKKTNNFNQEQWYQYKKKSNNYYYPKNEKQPSFQSKLSDNPYKPKLRTQDQSIHQSRGQFHLNDQHQQQQQNYTKEIEFPKALKKSKF